ncbi:MAG TPA: glycoside hydrolase family 2 TIM barrel-domain containing protein [Candidatus Dormibacteraeota bacterium]|nr:glycoside hydrolase family 2 TIM barrel-domain containing protein [Candidatus Dormibacteraeota bacterium]
MAAALVTSQPDRFAKESHGTSHAATGDISLNGEWRFRIDPGNVGTNENWAAADSVEAWGAVTVPHTWQIDSAHCDYRGIAWYRREFDALPSWSNSAVRLEFEAVFHTATVWVNGKRVGEHARRGYTAFAVDIATALRWDQPNVIAVRVDNGFNERMLPRGRSSDWAHDGGIFRPVRLLVTSKTFIERVEVEAIPDLRSMDASLTVSALCWNTSTKPWTGTAAFHIFDEVTGRIVASSAVNTKLVVSAGTSATVTMRETLTKAKLWHFDSPHLYRIKFQICDGGQEEHEFETTFGVRKFEIREGKFHLNGEAVRLMGVERMAGSNPTFGMAEPSDWIEHDHCDLKRLNCVFTRVHWPQDKRVLDYCDRHGILMQTEVPTWGPETFKGMGAQPDADIMENGLQQLREMIQRDRNHPSIVAWGLCNEIGGQNPPAYQFAKRMLQEAKQLDPGRLCSYASHSLGQTPERDVAGLMDFIEANEYFGTWQPGDARDLDKHLDKLHQTFPGKPIVISEYGYCACTPDRPEGDGHRIEIMKAHDEVIRSKDFVGGAIFFCYNDYRTHVGDRGTGALQQRVHGVVDVYGEPKASYTVLREESSPLESLTIENYGNAFRLELKTRRTIPSYTLRGYKLRGVFYGQGEIPVESQEVVIPEVSPGQTVKLDLMFTQSESPLRVRFEVMRPTQFSAYSAEWKPMKATG